MGEWEIKWVDERVIELVGAEWMSDWVCNKVSEWVVSG